MIGGTTLPLPALELRVERIRISGRPGGAPSRWCRALDARHDLGALGDPVLPPHNLPVGGPNCDAGGLRPFVADPVHGRPRGRFGGPPPPARAPPRRAALAPVPGASTAVGR